MFHSLWLPWTVARQAFLSTDIFRQEYWSELPFPPAGALPDPGIKPKSPAAPALAGGFFTTVPSGKPCLLINPWLCLACSCFTLIRPCRHMAFSPCRSPLGFLFFFFLFWMHLLTCGILVPWPGTPLHWKPGVFTTGLPGKALSSASKNSSRLD